MEIDMHAMSKTNKCSPKPAWISINLINFEHWAFGRRVDFRHRVWEGALAFLFQAWERFGAHSQQFRNTSSSHRVCLHIVVPSGAILFSFSCQSFFSFIIQVSALFVLYNIFQGTIWTTWSPSAIFLPLLWSWGGAALSHLRKEAATL